MSQTPQNALDRVKAQMMLNPNSLFYTSVFFSLNHVWDNSLPTAATDGVSVFFNEEYFMNCSPEQRMGLVLHETEHVMGMHMLRRGERDPRKWNIACDIVIDTGLDIAKFQVPDSLADRQYQDMTAEQVYDLLPEPPESYKPDILGAPGDGGEDGSIPAPMGPKELEEHINGILVRAATQVTAAGADPGQIPGSVQVYLKSLLSPQLPWEQLLARYTRQIAKTYYDFQKPNRRYFPDVILPTPRGEKIGHIAVAMDMSGSVTDEESRHFASETYAVVRKLRPKLLSLVQFDTAIKSVTDITSPADLADVKYHGRGGTDLRALMEWASENKPAVMVVFTDGYFDHNYSNPGVPVIWVIHASVPFNPPFGQVVEYQFKKP